MFYVHLILFIYEFHYYSRICFKNIYLLWLIHVYINCHRIWIIHKIVFHLLQKDSVPKGREGDFLIIINYLIDEQIGFVIKNCRHIIEHKASNTRQSISLAFSCNYLWFLFKRPFIAATRHTVCSSETMPVFPNQTTNSSYYFILFISFA